MTCEIVRDLIPMYVDETASNDTMLAVKRHIENCPDCKRFYNSCKSAEKKMSDVCREKILNPLKNRGSDISQLDQQFAHLSRKLKMRRIRQMVIGICVLCGVVVYIVSDIIKAVNKKNGNNI